MKVAINGAAGAMGKRIINFIAAADDCALVAAMERPDHPDLGKDAGVLAQVGPLHVALSAELSEAPDVVLDFSAPEAAVACARECGRRGIPIVIGTTGLTAKQRAEIEGLVAAKTAVLIAPNMSLGVNLLFSLAGEVAGALPTGYDIEIVETHHRRKQDAPSGTALELARRICAALGRDPDSALVYERKGRVGQRTPDEIAIHAVRGGDVVGDHTVIFAGEGERIELTHRAGSRDVFARGAVQAGRFLVAKPAGLYTMEDVLSPRP